MGGVRRALVSFALLMVMIVPAQARFFDGHMWDMPGQFMPDMGGFPFSGMGEPPFPWMGSFPQREWSVRVRLPTHGSGMSVMDVLENMKEISIFTAAVKAAGYDATLRGSGDYLVFAPTDTALGRDFSISDARGLLSDKSLLKGLLENSIVYKPAEGGRADDDKLAALSGREVVVLRTRSCITANGADVLKVIGAGNGMIIITDGAVGT